MKLLGYDVMTDYEPLVKLLEIYESAVEANVDKAIDKITWLFEDTFPGLTEAVMAASAELQAKRLRPTTVMYYNFRVQMWAMGFDADPSKPIRCMPKDVMGDPWVAK